MAEKAAGLPYSGTHAMYPKNARRALTEGEQPYKKNPAQTNPKVFSMRLAPYADISPMDTLRHWEKMMKAKEAGVKRGSPDLSAHQEFHKGVRSFYPREPQWPGEREFLADNWAGIASKAGGEPAGVVMEQRIQNAMVKQPMAKAPKDPVTGHTTYKWVRRPTPISRDEAIKQMRRGEVWALMGAPLAGTEEEQKR